MCGLTPRPSLADEFDPQENPHPPPVDSLLPAVEDRADHPIPTEAGRTAKPPALGGVWRRFVRADRYNPFARPDSPPEAFRGPHISVWTPPRVRRDRPHHDVTFPWTVENSLRHRGTPFTVSMAEASPSQTDPARVLRYQADEP